MKRAIDSVNEKILAAIQRRGPDIVAANRGRLPRLVAVSKLKPNSDIIEAYRCGQRFFGENYIQELEIKSNSSDIIDNCPDIKFHFIGHLQSNKVNKILKVRNLHMVETVDSIKLADLIDRAIDRRQKDECPSEDDSSTTNTCKELFGTDRRLKVMIQVNTSGEDQKSGTTPQNAPEIAKHITTSCKYLELAGVMTIGSFEERNYDGPNRDFMKLFEVRRSVAQTLNIDEHKLELSMGMSSDFEEAIAMGSTNVRVGSMIFGERPTKVPSA